MKNTTFNKVIVATLLLSSQISLAGSGQVGSAELQGKSFCRVVDSEGLFGQPAGERLHCLSFTKTSISDDANTFFGNPPESAQYYLDNNIVKFGSSSYVLSADGRTLTTIKGSTVSGVVFSIQE